MNEINFEEFYFEDIALSLHRVIQIENREIITKGFINSSIRKSLSIYVRSNDHNPSHFHIESVQRSYNQKFSVDEIKNVSKNKDHRFDVYIQKFFIKNSNFLTKIESKFYELNPNLI